MNATSTRTTHQTDSPKVSQFSIHLQNRVGALQDLVRMLNEHSVEIVALSVQDATDSALVRMVVTDPDLAEQLLGGNDISHSIVKVLVIELQEASQLGKMLTSLLLAEVNVDFLYPMLMRPGWRSAIVVHVEDNDCACAVLESNGFALLTQADISR